MENGVNSKGDATTSVPFLPVLQSLGQDHLVRYWPSLTEDQRTNLTAQISNLMPLDKICHDFDVSFDIVIYKSLFLASSKKFNLSFL